MSMIDRYEGYLPLRDRYGVLLVVSYIALCAVGWKCTGKSETELLRTLGILS